MFKSPPLQPESTVSQFTGCCSLEGDMLPVTMTPVTIKGTHGRTRSTQVILLPVLHRHRSHHGPVHHIYRWSSDTLMSSCVRPLNIFLSLYPGAPGDEHTTKQNGTMAKAHQNQRKSKSPGLPRATIDAEAKPKLQLNLFVCSTGNTSVDRATRREECPLGKPINFRFRLALCKDNFPLCRWHSSPQTRRRSPSTTLAC